MFVPSSGLFAATALLSAPVAGVSFAAAASAVALGLVCRGGWRDARLRRVFLLLAGFALATTGFGAATVWGGEWAGAVRVASAILAAAAGVALLRALPRAAAEQRERDADVARLRLLEAAVAACGDGVVIAAADPASAAGLRIRYANAAFERITGYTSEEVLGLSPSILADGAEPDALAVIRKALGGGETARVEVAGRRKDGSRVWTEWNVVPVVGPAGWSAHTVAVLRDATERRRAETALRESEAWFRALFEQAGDAMFLLDAGDRIVDANHRATTTLGYDREELSGLHFHRLGAQPEFGLDAGESLTAENCFRRKDGTAFPIELKFTTLDAGGRRLKLVIVRDVTRRRQAEQALREREELLRSVIAHIPCGVFWKDRNSVYLGCNDQVARDLGRSGPNEIVGRNDFDVAADPAEAESYRECDRKVMDTGRPILNLEESQTRPDRQVATLLTSKVPLRDAVGRVVGVLGVYQDITDRKRLEEQLRQAQKMEAIGRLAGGVAHDFNNLLTIIQGNAELLRDPAAAVGHTELLGDLLVAADRAAALVRQLLVFSRRQPVRPVVLDLNEIVESLAGMFRRLLGERITVKTRLDHSPVAVRADRSHLEQVLMNLAVNARDAMPDGGVVTISTEVVPGPGGRRTAVLTVSDGGCGMTDEVKARIFEPFFTTKGPDKGTGLGLATVFGIVQQAGGRIEVDSAPGAGSTFRVELPACEGPISSVTPTPLPASLSQGREGRGRSVLVVEDEDAVRKLARLTLEAAGYAVTDAPDAEAALERVAAGAGYDLLVTDLTMPGMDGHELACRVRERSPATGVVFMSGYVPEVARLEEVSGAVYVPKPFTPSEMLRAVGKALAHTLMPEARSA